MPQAISRTITLTDKVQERIEQRIETGHYPANRKLPTEKQFSEEFEVSRAVIREAIARLKADGVVTSKQGSGLFVVGMPGEQRFELIKGDHPGDQDMKDILELRLAIESTSAELAAQRRTKKDLAHLKQHLEAMAHSLEFGLDASEHDCEFHRAISVATHNPQIARFLMFLHKQFSTSQRPTWSERGYESGMAQAAHEEHLAIFKAIEKGSATAARKAIERHITNAAKRLGIDIQ